MRILFLFVLINLAFLNLFGQTDSIEIDTSKNEVAEYSEPQNFITEDSAKFDYKEALYQRKVESYTKMKKTGIVMGVSGSGMILLGSIMASAADWEQYSTSTSSGATTNDPVGIAGVFLIVVGVPLAVTGIVLGAVGSKKQKYYSGMLENLSLNISTSPQQTGLTLTYRF